MFSPFFSIKKITTFVIVFMLKIDENTRLKYKLGLKLKKLYAYPYINNISGNKECYKRLWNKLFHCGNLLNNSKIFRVSSRNIYKFKPYRFGYLKEISYNTHKSCKFCQRHIQPNTLLLQSYSAFKDGRYETPVYIICQSCAHDYNQKLYKLYNQITTNNI